MRSSHRLRLVVEPCGCLDGTPLARSELRPWRGLGVPEQALVTGRKPDRPGVFVQPGDGEQPVAGVLRGEQLRAGQPGGGHRQLNSALYRVMIVRMRFHQPTIDYVARRTAEGKTKQEIIRCLKRYLAREFYQYIKAKQPPTKAT
ncbi:hypothetical protein ACFRQM_14220 [Streptomyces sp. NPDC056831]|uniref:hypothetical protein n=1 Tax=Streptomyces sp. NPDC056831 TaxID=3345954 RepID=UPI0036B07AB8